MIPVHYEMKEDAFRFSKLLKHTKNNFKTHSQAFSQWQEVVTTGFMADKYSMTIIATNDSS